MQENHHELWYALTAITFIALSYLLVSQAWEEVPPASEFFGHSLGIIGFILMLMTEILYTLRKRSRSARWGRMSVWLKFHIFTGVVGPFMVLLHSSWKFNGLAGIVMLLTVVIVVSGFFGRYVYTAIPRTLDGIEMESGEFVLHQADLDAAVRSWMNTVELQPHQEVIRSLIQGDASGKWNASAWKAVHPSLDQAAQGPFNTLAALVKQRFQMQQQFSRLEKARRVLGIWHTVHVPLGLTLFTMSFIHIVAAVYYATLLK